MKRNVKTTVVYGLSDRDARILAKQIVKDASEVRVKFGKTNGAICLHVYVPGSASLAHTIYSAAQWDNHPANPGPKKTKRQMAEALEVAKA